MMRIAFSLAALLVAQCDAYSRFDVGVSDKKGNPFTCGGAPMSAQIKKNVRGENPDVPVSIIARCEKPPCRTLQHQRVRDDLR